MRRHRFWIPGAMELFICIAFSGWRTGRWNKGLVMPIEDLKTWHWIVIGALVGLLMGYVMSLAGPPRDPNWRIPISNELFVDHVGEDSPDGPRFRSLEIHVPRDGRDLVTG